MTAAFLHDNYESRADASANVAKTRAVENTFFSYWKRGVIGDYELSIVIADGVVQHHSVSYPHGACGLVSPDQKLFDFATVWADALTVGWHGEVVVTWQVRDGQHERVSTVLRKKFR